MQDKILVIDDDKSVRTMISFALSKKYQVESKADGKEGVEWLEKNNVPNLILLDLMMPMMNGFEFIKYLKTSSKLKDVPIIVLSGTESMDDRKKCGEFGVKEFLKKPFNPNELEFAIQKALNSMRLENMKKISAQIKSLSNRNKE
jgi:two-component system chemotaxis response regulator CheY